MINHDITGDSVRATVYRYIANNPGINYSAIRKGLSYGSGTVTYHLSVLTREGYIRAAVNGNLKLFWLKSDFPGPGEAMMTGVQKNIMELLGEHGTMSRIEIRQRLNIPSSTLHMNIKQLEEWNQLESEKRGRTFHYWLRDA